MSVARARFYSLVYGYLRQFRSRLDALDPNHWPTLMKACLDAAEGYQDNFKVKEITALVARRYFDSIGLSIGRHEIEERRKYGARGPYGKSVDAAAMVEADLLEQQCQIEMDALADRGWPASLNGPNKP